MSKNLEALAAQLGKLLSQKLDAYQFDVLEVFPVPTQSDRIVRLRAIEDLVEDFDGYLIKVKPKEGVDLFNTENATHSKNPGDFIHQPDGKLNIPFLFENAQLLYSSGDYALARNIYHAIFQSGHRNIEALNGIGRCYEAEGNLEEAKESYDKSIAYRPNFDAFQCLALIHIQQKNEGMAVELLERALELNPQAVDLRAKTGYLLLQLGKITEAKKQFEDTLSTHPRHDKALAGIASCYLAEGNKRLAHDYLVKSLQIELNNPTAIYQLIKCAYEIKTYAKTAQILEKYIQIAPINTNLLYSLAGLQFHLGRFEDATITTRNILRISNDHSGAKDLLDMIDNFSRRKA